MKNIIATSKVLQSKIQKVTPKNSKRRRISLTRLSILFIVLAAVIYILSISVIKGYAAMSSYVKENRKNVVMTEAVKSKVIESGETKAVTEADVIAQVARLIQLPQENMDIMVKVKNPKILENESDFYKGVKKDDYIIVYPSLALIYEAKSDTIVKSTPLK